MEAFIFQMSKTTVVAALAFGGVALQSVAASAMPMIDNGPAIAAHDEASGPPAGLLAGWMASSLWLASPLRLAPSLGVASGLAPALGPLAVKAEPQVSTGLSASRGAGTWTRG